MLKSSLITQLVGTAGDSRAVAVLQKIMSKEDTFAVFKHRVLLLMFLDTTHEALIT